MSTTEAEMARQQQADSVARLLKEYADKLNLMASRLLGIPERDATAHGVRTALSTEVGTILDGCDAVAPTIESLTRYASQMLEHFAPEKLTEIELTLRLRETEQALDAVRLAADTLKNHYPAFLPNSRKNRLGTRP